MTIEELQRVAVEIRVQLSGLRFGRIFPLSSTSAAIDFVPHNGVYLFFDLSRRHRSAYLIVRRVKYLERNSVHPPPFATELRKNLSGAILENVTVDPTGLMLGLSDDAGTNYELALRLFASNPGLCLRQNRGEPVFLMGEDSRPEEIGSDRRATIDLTVPDEGGSVSKALDKRRLAEEEKAKVNSLVRSARKHIKDQIQRRRRLLTKLDGDLAKHGDAATWKYYGDLLLSNLSLLKDTEGEFLVIDHFDENQPEIRVPKKDGLTATQTAEFYFDRYAKARKANAEIVTRKESIHAEIAAFETQRAHLENAVANHDLESLIKSAGPAKQATPKVIAKQPRIREARAFISVDGVDILVGRSARDNDTLTFKIGRSNDIWLHAADYPGSHVIVRNPGKKPLSSTTLVEAAKLAAFYSEARLLGKVAVNYTYRKFVNKPKKAAPGLVRLSSFKTILVEPEFPSSLKRKYD